MGMPDRKAKSWLLAAAILTAAVSSQPRPAQEAWPPFLPPRDTFGTDIVAAVEHVWLDPTLVRKVRGHPAHVPFDVYLAFVDAPDVTAAAARHLRLVRYHVEALGGDWYHADDDDGSRGIYRVIERDEHHRVILSWGEHSGRLLGTVSGSALSLVDLEPDGTHVIQQISAYVRIDNSVAAALARMFVQVFGFLADRKLVEGFTVTAKVAEWAVDRPHEFCEWLAQERLPDERRRAVLAVLPRCS